MIYLAYGLAWISTACVVAYAIHVSQDPNYLWAMFIPLFISLSTKKG